MKQWFWIMSVTILLLLTIIMSATTGTLAVTPISFIQGLWSGHDPHVEIVKDLRLPRIVIAIFAGAALAVSGILLQAVMRNPLAEPGIIGVSAGASFTAVAAITLWPTLFFYMPFFAILGGAFAFYLVYRLSWSSGLDPLRMILIGVAINAVFTSLGQVLHFSGGISLSATSDVAMSQLAMRQWSDVRIIVMYVTLGLIAAFSLFRGCNHLSLSDATAHSLGVPVQRLRLVISAIAVLLASVATAVAGMFLFVGLLIPHISRRIVGTNHRYLIPFSALLGAWLILLSDTLGRTLIAPQEIPASVIVALIGGPFLIMLLRRERHFARF
ncbi:iron ABC transporter permease [Savagea sp. SN6]|uniref:Probable heme-iron transport system permease protein IsdF n=1 Tax=Savagea serpentis TaxID=2785297 RepID=A0A8J7G739_9BACL|nr:iron ABC transporter permease [Savagea serpentis]MBF4500388.1 iron ABC transporter permease [Savagea serpentis]